jgi:hypothetical protein
MSGHGSGHGWLDERRHRHAVEQWQAAESAWAAEQEQLAGLVTLAGSFAGVTRADEPRLALELRGGERVFLTMAGVALIEPRRLPGTWQGGYSGFSFRVARGVRWHVGGTRGHTVPGAEVPTPIDTGQASITNQRVVFQGAKQAREWLFAKLIGYQHDPNLPWTAIQVSNRQKVSGLLYDREHAEEVHFRLALALAHFHDDVAGLMAQLTADVQAHAAQRPLPPPPLPA